MGKVSLKKKAISIVSICCTCIFMGLLFPRGIYLTSDDGAYSQAAYNISQRQFQIPTNHFNARIGNTFSIALFYFIFGVNEYSAIGSSLLFSLLTILLIFLLSQEIFEKNNSFKIGLIGSVLFIFVPISITMRTSFLPHQGQTFFMLFSIYFLLRGEKNDSSYGYYFMSGLCIGISYLFHETGVFAFFMIAAHFIVKKKFNKGIFLILFGSFLVFACEDLIYYLETNKFLYRQMLALKSHFRIKDISDIMLVRTKFKPIENPFSGTFIGDSWLLEPFRQLLVNPTHSIIYHLFFLVSISLLIKKDKNILYLNLLFWSLFLYLSYGSQSSLSYAPLRRLPRYILPCLIPVCITVGYGIDRLLKHKYLQTILIIFFAFISIFCISIKGGDIGQRFHQSKFFYQFMQENPDKQFFTDSVTSIGLDFLSKYQPLKNVQIFPFRDFIQKIQANEFLRNNNDSYVFINIPEIYEHSSIHLNEESYILIAQHNRKPRKICHVFGIRSLLKDNLCDLSNGGKIYKVR